MRTRALPILVVLVACAHKAPPTPAPPPPVAVAERAPSPPTFSSATIDATLDAAWKKDGVEPAPPCDDSTFLRRIMVDLVGKIPTPEAAQAFAANKDPAKRRKTVAALLASPDYAEHWMNYWDDVLMGKETKAPIVDRMAFRGWLRSRFEANTPYDRMVHDLLAATGQNSIGGARVRFAFGMTPTADAPGKPAEPGEVSLDQINGAVNYTLRFQDAPQDLAGSASRTFLGVQIQCAQCHDHKSEKWKQDDFRKLTSAFLHFQIDPIDPGKNGGMVRRVDIKDAAKIQPRVAKNPEFAPIAQARATALDGTDLEKGQATRKELARWITSPKNPWFAKAIVNRMWGHFLGRGFVDPVDDFRASNPATMPELLDLLAADFVAHDHDLKHLIRTIAETRAYNLSARAEAKVDPDNRAWAKFRMVPLGPEELLNALFQATNVDGALKQAGVANVDQLRFQLVKNFTFLFDVDEDFDSHDFVGTITQSLTLLNGNLTNYGARTVPGAALAEIVAKNQRVEENVAAIYWRVLSRRPTDDELQRAVKYVQTAVNPAPRTFGPPPPPRKRGAADPLQRLGNKAPTTLDPKKAAYEDLFWTLLNSSEFLFNH